MTTFQEFESSFPDEAKARGLIGMPVSAFDHWLSEDEVTNSTPFLSYQEAREKGFEQEYLQTELRFSELLNTLSGGGVSLIRFPDQLHFINSATSRWRNVVKRGLRYKFSDELYFHNQDARFVFNWDLTHWFFFRRIENAAAVAELVKATGLHVLKLDPDVALAD